MDSSRWHSSAGNTEDLALTPAERAAAKSAAEKVHLALDEELAGFEAADTIELGAGSPGVVVIGAGLVGALCATMLAKKGLQVHLFERYGDIRSIPSVGRSINLSVTSRGLRAVQ